MGDRLPTNEAWGLGVLHLEMFVSALILGLLWLHWVDDSISWIGLGNPWNDHDRYLFVAATVVTVGYGDKAPF